MVSSSQGKGKRLSESQRIEIIRDKEKAIQLGIKNPPSNYKIAMKYGVTETAVRNIWKHREKIKKRCAPLTQEKVKTVFRASTGKFPELENVVYEWIEDMRNGNVQVSPCMVQSHAQKIAVLHELPNFQASAQWLAGFKER